MYIKDIKLFAKNEKVLETLIQKIRIYSPDIGMEFGIEKCVMLITRSRKRQMIEVTELPDQERTRMFGEKETYNYLGILEAVNIKQVGIKRKKEKSISDEWENFSKPSRNLIKEINSWVVPFVRYSEPLLKWMQEELGQMNQRKLMMMHKALHPWDNIDRRYMFRKERGRDLTSIDDSINTSIQGLEEYVEKSKERLIIETRNSKWSIEQQLENRNGKKNNCMNISIDKQVKSHMKKIGNGKETLREKLNLF